MFFVEREMEKERERERERERGREIGFCITYCDNAGGRPRRRMNSIPQSFAFSTILSKSEVTSSVS